MAKRNVEKLVGNGDAKVLPPKVPAGKAPMDTAVLAQQDVTLCIAVENAAGLRNKLLASVAAEALRLQSKETRTAFVNGFMRNLSAAWITALADGMKIEGKQREQVGLALAALNAGTKQWQTLLPGAKGKTEIRDGRSYAILSGLAAAYRSTPTTYISQARSRIMGAIEGGMATVKLLEAATTAREAELAVSSKAGTIAVRNKAGDPVPVVKPDSQEGAQPDNKNAATDDIVVRFTALLKELTNPQDALLCIGNLLHHVHGQIKMEGPDAKMVGSLLADYKRFSEAQMKVA